MSAPIRWGIMGTGKIARILAGALAGSTSGDLVAVASRSPERAQAFAGEFGVARAHGDYAGLVDDPEVDLVYVATHHPDHREWAVRAAEAGRHVLCEKPLAVHTADAERIVAAASGNGVFLMEAFAYRCHPQTERLVDLLSAGTIGEIRMIDAIFGYDAGPRPTNYLLDQALAGGSILDVGCYTTSMAHLIARVAGGGEVAEATEVSGGGAIGPSGVDHWAAATLTFGGGLLARVATSVQLDLGSWLRIDGSEGRITVPSPWLPGRIGARSTILVERRGAVPTEKIDVPLRGDVYATEIEAVAGFVERHELSPSAMPWEESLANLRTLDRWRASIGLRYEGEPAVASTDPAADAQTVI